MDAPSRDRRVQIIEEFADGDRRHEHVRALDVLTFFERVAPGGKKPHGRPIASIAVPGSLMPGDRARLAISVSTDAPKRGS